MHFALLSAILPILNYTLTLPASLLPQPRIPNSGETMSPLLSEHPESPLDVENYPTAPPGLDLKQVHIYVRHGERAPVGQRLTSPKAGLPEHWLLCKTGRAMRAIAVESAAGKGSMHNPSLAPIGRTQGNGLGVDPYLALSHVRKAVERKDGTTEDGECMLGELTDLGRQSTFHYGVALRTLYIDRLKFLPSVLRNDETAYFRSTNMPRTIESLQHILHGLYPPTTDQTFIPKILIRNAKDENILGNMFACRRLELLNLAFAQAAADTFNPLLAKLDPRVSTYIGGPLRIDGKPRASGVLDTLRAAQAHGFKVPSVFEEEDVIELLERSVVSEWFGGYKYHEFRRLAMGRLLDDLQRKMSHKASLGENDPLKVLIHSTHDTALAGLCATLDVFDHLWPSFTAAVTFELFSSSYPLRDSTKAVSLPSFFQPIASFFAGSPLNSIPKFFSSSTTVPPRYQHFVRMRYRNRTLPLPICADPGNHLDGHPEFCKLQVFNEAIKDLVPGDFDVECQNSTELDKASTPIVAPRTGVNG